MTTMPRRPRRWGTLTILLALQAAAFLIYLGVETLRRRDTGVPWTVERAAGPRLPAVDLAGPDGSIRALGPAAAQAVLLHFWATWCPPCREELPALLALRQDRLGGGLEVIAVSMDRDWEPVREFFGGPIPPEVVRDPGGRLAEAYGVAILPDTLLIGRDGIPILRFRGAVDWRSGEARRALRTGLDD